MRISENASLKMLKQINNNSNAGKFGVDVLSDREIEVFEMEGRGFATSEIAEKMSLSPKTVESYKKQIKDKLGFNSHVELRYHAILWHLTEMWPPQEIP